MKFILLTHERELTKGTNTGRLVKEVLGDKVDIIIWKRKEPDQRLLELLASKQAAILFPDVFDSSLGSDEPVVSDEPVGSDETIDSPIRKKNDFDYLVILDATWQQARKMFNRSAYLNQADRVALNCSTPSEFKLRRNQIDGGLSTVECVIELLRQTDLIKERKLLEESFYSFNVK